MEKQICKAAGGSTAGAGSRGVLLADVQLVCVAGPAEVSALELVTAVFQQTGSSCQVSATGTVFSWWQDNEIKVWWRPDSPKFPKANWTVQTDFSCFSSTRTGLICLNPVVEVNLNYCCWKYRPLRAWSVSVVDYLPLFSPSTLSFSEASVLFPYFWLNIFTFLF